MNTLAIKPLQMSEKLYIKWVEDGRLRINEDGELEKRCSRCEHYWPADGEFYFCQHGRGDGLHNQCRACYQETRYPNGRSQVQKAA